MTTSQMIKKFEALSKLAERYNTAHKTKRFFMMSQTHNYRVIEIGVYDHETKKYALTDVRAYNAVDVLTEIENMLSTASKK